MKVLPTLVSLTVLLGASVVSAADLTNVDRTIKKEPPYAGQPRYCLLVFGPEATTKVWLVVDDDKLYVDRKRQRRPDRTGRTRADAQV